MTLIQRRSDSGLVLAEQAMDEQSITRALKTLDGRLVLQKHPRNVEGGYVYKVLRVWSDSHEPAIVLTWMDEYGTPLPLSSGLIDEVQRHMLGARNARLDADEYNRRFEARVQADADYARSELIREHKPRVERGRVSVSLGEKNRKRDWMKENRGRVTR